MRRIILLNFCEKSVILKTRVFKKDGFSYVPSD